MGVDGLKRVSFYQHRSILLMLASDAALPLASSAMTKISAQSGGSHGFIGVPKSQHPAII
jgi:hypothetical protein